MTKLIFQKTDIGLGKRKQAVARVFLVPGKGNITINKVSGNKYLQYNDTYLTTIAAPLKAVKLDSQFDIIAFVRCETYKQNAVLAKSRFISRILFIRFTHIFDLRLQQIKGL